MRMTTTLAIRLLASLGVAACVIGLAAAQTVSDKAKEAEGLAVQGKFTDALVALDDAASLLWDKAPLECRRVLWVAEGASGFGEYNPRETNVFSSGEAMLAYAEPIGFGWRKSGDLWHAEMVADVVIRSKDGTELHHQDDFGRFPVASRARNREFFLNLTFTLSGIPTGEYIVETVLRDTVSGKKGSCALPFTICPLRPRSDPSLPTASPWRILTHADPHGRVTVPGK